MEYMLPAGCCRGACDKHLFMISVIDTPTATSMQAGAGDEARTRDVLLGKEVLYH
jgi:hypothetical protein